MERLEKDKDTDNDADADRDRMGSPVVDIDFRVSGLPHAVVKQVENSRVRKLVKVILIDKIFKLICNNVMPTTHSVKNQRR